MNQLISEQEKDIKTIIINSITKLLPAIIKELALLISEKSKEFIEEKLFTRK